MKKFLVYFCFVTLILSLQTTAHASSPLDALKKAQKGIDTASYDTFCEGVDVDAILDHATETSLSTLKKAADEGTLNDANPVLLLMLSSANLHDQAKVKIIKALIGSEVKSALIAGIDGGYFSGSPNGKINKKQSALLDGISTKRKQIIPGKIISEKGNHAIMTAVVNDAEAGSFPLELAAHKQNSQWRITRINNLEKILHNALGVAK